MKRTGLHEPPKPKDPAKEAERMAKITEAMSAGATLERMLAGDRKGK